MQNQDDAKLDRKEDLVQVLPDKNCDFFFSVAVRDGVVKTQIGADVRDEIIESPDLFRSSCIGTDRDIRQQHLQWCLHRGPEHACHPALFWRTPFVDESNFNQEYISYPQASEAPARNQGLAENSLLSPQKCPTSPRSDISGFKMSKKDLTTSSPSLELRISHIAHSEKSCATKDQHKVENNLCPAVLSRYLSQFAHDRIFPKSTAEKNKEKEKSQKILVYIVCPDHLLEQTTFIRRMWEDAFPTNQAIIQKNEKSESRFFALVQTMSPKDFQKECTIFSPSKKNKRGEMSNESLTDKPIDKLAALRGAGVLHGYPSLVFDGNSSSASFICADRNGDIIGDGKGLGLSANLAFGESKCIATKTNNPNSNSDSRIVSDSDESQNVSTLDVSWINHPIDEMERKISHVLTHAALVGDANFEKIESFTGDLKLETSIANAFQEFGINGRKVVSKWLQLTRNSVLNSDRNVANDSYQACKNVLDNGLNEQTKQSHTSDQISCNDRIFDLRQNSKKNILTTGSDCGILSHLLCNINGRKEKKEEAVCTIDVNWKYDEKEATFPWNHDSSCSWIEKYPRQEFVKQKKSQRCPVVQNKFLIHYGVTASIMVQLLRQQETEGIRQQETEGIRQQETKDISSPDGIVNGTSKESIQKKRKSRHSNNLAAGAEVYLHLVGRRIAKSFITEDDGDTRSPTQQVDIFRGSIDKIENAEDGEVWFFINYDDGDSEHVGEEEVYELLKNYSLHGEANLSCPQFSETSYSRGIGCDNEYNGRSNKRKRVESNINSTVMSDDSVSLTSGARSPMDSAKLFLNKRVAKSFDGYIFFGTITGCVNEEARRSTLTSIQWNVLFDDGDKETFSKAELTKALKLYAKMQSYDVDENT